MTGQNFNKKGCTAEYPSSQCACRRETCLRGRPVPYGAAPDARANATALEALLGGYGPGGTIDTGTDRLWCGAVPGLLFSGDVKHTYCWGESSRCQDPVDQGGLLHDRDATYTCCYGVSCWCQRAQLNRDCEEH